MLLNLNLPLQEEEIKEGIVATLSQLGDSWELALFSVLIGFIQFSSSI